MKATKILSLLAAALILFSCSTHTDSTIKIFLTARDSKTGEALNNSSFKNQGRQIGQNKATVTLREEPGTTKTYEVTKDGYWKNSITITFTKSGIEDIFLDKKR